MVPVRERNNGVLCKAYIHRVLSNFDACLTVVDVIQISVRVFWVINDQRPTQAITVLGLVMAVIPICTLRKQKNKLSRSFRVGKFKYSLLPRVELVAEAPVRYNRTLSDEGSSVGVIGTCLEYPVPMLWKIGISHP